jgi:hypothetical protein
MAFFFLFFFGPFSFQDRSGEDWFPCTMGDFRYTGVSTDWTGAGLARADPSYGMVWFGCSGLG